MLRKNGKLKLADLVVSIRKGLSMYFAPSMLSPPGHRSADFVLVATAAWPWLPGCSDG